MKMMRNLLWLLLALGTGVQAGAPSLAGVLGEEEETFLHPDQAFTFRAFTNDEISFQLLASAVARSAPSGGATVRLERTWLAPQQASVITITRSSSR